MCIFINNQLNFTLYIMASMYMSFSVTTVWSLVQIPMQGIEIIDARILAKGILGPKWGCHLAAILVAMEMCTSSPSVSLLIGQLVARWQPWLFFLGVVYYLLELRQINRKGCTILCRQSSNGISSNIPVQYLTHVHAVWVW